MKRVIVYITDEQRDAIDAVRASTTSRNVWVRKAVDEKLAAVAADTRPIRTAKQ